jgi:hypothetical protein
MGHVCGTSGIDRSQRQKECQEPSPFFRDDCDTAEVNNVGYAGVVAPAVFTASRRS